MQVPIDETRWPLVSVRWAGAISDQWMHEFLAKMNEWLARRERFALLLDSRGARGISPESRKLLIGHMKDNAELTARYLVQAIVLDNLMQRTLFYGINLIFPNPFPSKVFADVEEASAWLSSELEKA